VTQVKKTFSQQSSYNLSHININYFVIKKDKRKIMTSLNLNLIQVHLYTKI